MLAPAVMFIEMAADALKRAAQLDDDLIETRVRQSQEREIHSFGDVRAQAIGASGLSADFLVGYRLGIETARAVVNNMPAAIAARVSI